MTIQVKLYGDLRKRVSPEISGTASILLDLDESEIKYVIDALNNINIEADEVGHIFVNHRYAGLRKSVKDGDTVALFPRNMLLLYKWYFTREEDE
jgi:molybdopterin converting factor small subunit